MVKTVKEKNIVMCSERDENPEIIEDLAFTLWQYNANEKAYANNLITKVMYEYAREELGKVIDHMSKLCYSVSEDR